MARVTPGFRRTSPAQRARDAGRRATGHAPPVRCARPRQARSRRVRRPPEPRPAPAGHRRPAQRRQIDPEMLPWVGGGERRRQYLGGEGPQQMRLAVDQIRERPRAQRPGRKIRHAPLGIGNAARPAARIAGASLGETPLRIARAMQKGIRVNRLKFLDSASGKQEIAGRIGQIGNYFRHRRGSETNEASMWVHRMFPSRAAAWAHAPRARHPQTQDRRYG
jgi:hypothetical protein